MQYEPNELNEILNIFKTESSEIIQQLNDGFLELEKNPTNKKPIKRLLQLSHSLKGAARMLGFNSIQNIAHKIEDILSFWKNDEVKINDDFFKVVYTICDFLVDIVAKSVEKKSDIQNETVENFLNKLNEFIIYNYTITIETVNNSNSEEKEISNIDVDAILIELIFVFDKETNDCNDEEILAVVLDNVQKLSDIFVNSQYIEIKNKISSIINQITNNNQLNYDLDYFKNLIVELRTTIYTKFKESQYNISKKENIETNNTSFPKLPTVIADNFDFIFANLEKIKTDKNIIILISEKITELLNIESNKDFHLILEKILSILNLYVEKDISIENNCYIVILQCLYLSKRIILNQNDNNVTFMLKRLKLVEDILNIQTQNNKQEIIPFKPNEVILPDNFENITKTIDNLNLQEIKTLRVDITKLDNLIAQTGELLVNGIKNREHLTDLAKINTKLALWTSESKKFLNYIKYYDKKGFLSSSDSNMSGVFYKKIQKFFNENINLLNDLNKDFIKLYNVILEDDNKLHQTVVEIDNIAKGIRVLPFATILHSFPRMIRDIAKEYNKKVNFVVAGSDTTIDKKIIEEIKLPLIHIIRNSISHGIELPEERIKNNKNETGTIKISAKQSENNIIITIEDDGYGIDIDKIKEITEKKGLLLKDEINTLTNEQLMKLIFLPGFSTDENITEISGRGVGLDVVKTKISNLNGEIKVDSVLTKGCKTIIKLPLSLATVKTFIVRVNNQKYALPLNSIKFVKLISENEIYQKDGNNCILFEDHSIPIYKLSSLLNYEEIQQTKETLTVIIIENQGMECALIADELIGSYEVFRKKLVPPIIKIKNISGFTTLSDGEICLIINPYELLNSI